MALKVGVFGAGGRMGSTVCRAVAADSELELVAAVDPHHAGIDLLQIVGEGVPALEIAKAADALAHEGAVVGVDFTELDAARENLRWMADNGVHAVVGTTGFTDEDYEWIAEAFTDSNCLVAPNFAIGAVLMMRFAELAAPYFDTAEVIEMHHDAKVDAPSGTAVNTLRRMAEASGDWAPDPTEHESVEHARGGRGPGDLRVHSVRMRGVVAHQEVLLGTTGQTLTIRHDSYDRESFMPGVLRAVKAVSGRPGLTVGLDDLLEI